MKVIGKGDNATYICEVNHTEIEKFLALYYNKLPLLRVGQEVDLGRGYDYSVAIRGAFKQSQDFIKSHETIVKAILNGLSILNEEEK